MYVIMRYFVVCSVLSSTTIIVWAENTNMKQNQINNKTKYKKENNECDPILMLLRNETEGELGKNGCSSPASQIINHREKTINGLLKIISNKSIDRTASGPVPLSLRLLGTLRAKEAVKPLTKMLRYYPQGYEPNLELNAPSPVMYYFPAADALGEIGKPAQYEMLQKIFKSDSKLERKLAAWVLLRIECQAYDDFEDETDEVIKKAVLLRLRDYMKGTEGETRAHFQEAIDFVKSFKETDGPPEEIPGFLDEDDPGTKNTKPSEKNTNSENGQ